jgi:glutathione S-transferase
VLGELNPAWRIPTLVLDDGRAIAESNAIIWYLATDTPYLPEDRYERAKILQWLFFEQYSHEPFIATVRFWVNYAPDPPPQSEIESRRAVGYLALDALERHLALEPFLVGRRYSIADIALYGYTHVAEEGGFDLSRYAAVHRWLDRVARAPGHVPITA